MVDQIAPAVQPFHSLAALEKPLKEQRRYSYTCILIGGQEEMAARPIAIFLRWKRIIRRAILKSR